MNDLNFSAPADTQISLEPMVVRLGNNLNVAQLLDQIAATARRTVAADVAFVALYDGESGVLERLATAGSAADDEAPALPGDAQIVAALLAGSPATTHTVGATSQLYAPLVANGRPRGVLLAERDAAAPFDEADVVRLDAFATQAAVTIDNALLFRETDKALARRVEELSLFQRIDQELNRSLDLAHTLGLALDWAISLTGADSGAIGLVESDEDQTLLRLLVYQGEYHTGARDVPADHPVLAQVLAEDRSILTTDVTPDHSFDGTAATTQLAVPIRRDETIIGVIALESHELSAFATDDMRFVERFADRAAVAIANARLYERIEQINDSRSEFVSLVTHELRIPLTSIRGYADLMHRGLAGPLNERQTEFLDVIRRNLDRMSTLLSDLGAINRLEAGRMQFAIEPVDLATLLADVVANQRETLATRDQALRLDIATDLPPVSADAHRLSQVFDNLVSNAHKYSPSGTTVTIRARRAGETAVVDVVDQGVGIREEEVARLFTQFYRSEDAVVREQVGWGLGLSIVRMLVETMGGAIACRSTYGDGSTFSVTLPLAG